jgi:hypothetical protein
MLAYRTYVTIADPKQIIITDVPFAAGEQVEVLILAQTTTRTVAIQRLDALFERTQALPQVQQLTEAEIIAEIEAYRAEL